jgi:L-threonylcarbamoyladenylate synthase
MPNHTFALDLLRRAGPLATTSANRSGAANATMPEEVLAQLDGRIHLLLDGGLCPGGVPSTVVDCTQSPPVVLRKGAITEEEIQLNF